MLISIEKRFVFVANTKAASTSIENALIGLAEIHRGGPPRHKHIPMSQVLTDYDFLFSQPAYAPESFFRFGVMRDPVDWIFSWFRYRKGNKVAHPLPEGTTFRDFWANLEARREAEGPGAGPRHQHAFFTDAGGQLLVDYIIPYEDLSAHFARINAHLRTRVKLPRSNVSRLEGSDADVPDDLKPRIRAFYARDYALLEQIAEINAAAGLAA